VNTPPRHESSDEQPIETRDHVTPFQDQEPKEEDFLPRWKSEPKKEAEVLIRILFPRNSRVNLTLM